MKKRIKLLFIFMLLTPYIVLADMSAPMIRPYQMIVTNPEGIDCTCNYPGEEYHLNKDDVFTVDFEYDSNYSITVGEQNCTIKSLTGSSLLKDEINPATEINNDDKYIKKENTAKEALVYAEEGVDVKKGPANIYETVGHLDKNTKFTYAYYTSDMTHIYIFNSEISGWVEILNLKVLIENKEQYIVKNNITLPCTTIPQNTILKPKYVSDAWSRMALIEYDGCSKLVEKTDGDITNIFNNKYTIKKDAKIYQYINDNGKYLGEIEANAQFIGHAFDGIRGEENIQLYIEYNDIKGWISINYNDYEYVESNENEETETENQEQTEQETTTNETEENTDPINYVTTYVIIGLSIAVIALLILLLINRKKAKNHQIND